MRVGQGLAFHNDCLVHDFAYELFGRINLVNGSLNFDGLLALVVGVGILANLFAVVQVLNVWILLLDDVQ